MIHPPGGLMTQTAAKNGAAVAAVSAPYAVVSVHFDKSKDPAVLLRALEASHIRLAACRSVEEARQQIDRLRPIAGLLYFGASMMPRPCRARPPSWNMRRGCA
jgi:hypothetical protein